MLGGLRSHTLIQEFRTSAHVGDELSYSWRTREELYHQWPITGSSSKFVPTSPPLQVRNANCGVVLVRSTQSLLTSTILSYREHDLILNLACHLSQQMGPQPSNRFKYPVSTLPATSSSLSIASASSSTLGYLSKTSASNINSLIL